MHACLPRWACCTYASLAVRFKVIIYRAEVHLTVELLNLRELLEFCGGVHDNLGTWEIDHR